MTPPAPGPLVKICGLTQASDAQVAADGGADFLGFIHYPESPRHIGLDQARRLKQALPSGPARVGVVVDASLQTIQQLQDALGLSHIQLHGDETSDDIKAIKASTGLYVIKVIKVAQKEDLITAVDMAKWADILLFDTKPGPGDTLPGGNARSFPWHLLKGLTLPAPILLAGGLTPENAQKALAESGAQGLDVSSGVERHPGEKSQALITAFLNAAKSPNKGA